MPKISCTVETCYYNREKICQVEVLQIGGEGAAITEATYCQSYTDRESSHNEIEQGRISHTTRSIYCDVNTCVYNEERQCSLNEIEVSSLGDVKDYTSTDCLSFDRR